jgi:hypothetical protein
MENLLEIEKLETWKCPWFRDDLPRRGKYSVQLIPFIRRDFLDKIWKGDQFLGYQLNSKAKKFLELYHNSQP